MSRRRYTGPLIAQSAITNYLERELDEWDWIKQATREQLEDGLGDFVFSYSKNPLFKRPFLHQLQGFELAKALPQFLFFQDMGAGKSALMLATFRWHKQHNDVKRMLVVVPREVHLQSWVDQIDEHAPDLSYIELVGSSDERHALLEQDADVFIISYPGLHLMMTHLQKVKNRKHRRRQILPALAKRFAKRFGMVVLDESHRIGNAESLVHRECRHFTHHVEYRYALTGTPFGRDPTPLWPQFYVIDDGETLGRTLGLFRAVFFNAKDRFWGGVEYEFDTRMEEDLRRMIKHRSIYYEDKEFSDLPPMTPPKPVRVRFSVSAEEQYRNVVKRIQEARGSKEELKNAFVRMRMCTSGYLSVKSDLEDRLTLYFEENPKLDMLEEMIEDIPQDSKCIIYHQYVLTAKLIRDMLRKNKHKFATLAGDTKDQRADIRKFLRDDSCRFLVANNESGSDGINPQRVCNYVIFFETPVSPITRKQAIKRVYREGQQKHVHIYDLIVPNSVDEKILGYLAEGKDMFDAILKGGKEVLL